MGISGQDERIDDFPILKLIVEEDTEQERHKPAEEGDGFLITDDTVWEDLSAGLNARAKELQGPDRLIFIEFARDSYLRSFEQFSSDVLENSIVVYIDAPFELSWKRNVQRWEEEEGLDAHLVSKDEMKKTYAKDDNKDLPDNLEPPVYFVKNDYSGLDKLRENLQDVVEKIKELIERSK